MDDPLLSALIRRSLLVGAVWLGACVDDASLGDVPSETDGQGGTAGSDTPAGGSEDTETGFTEVIGGCERVAGGPGDDYAWALVCGSSGADTVEALAIMPGGDLLVAIETTTKLDAPQLPNWSFDDEDYILTGSSNNLLLRFDSTGALVWSRYLISESEPVGIEEFAVCGDGFVVSGSGYPVDLGDGDPVSGDFFARFDGDGTLRWKRVFERSTDPLGSFSVLDIDCDDAGNVAFAGGSRYGVDFGQGLLPSKASDAFVAKLDADGELLFATMLLAGAPPPDFGTDEGALSRSVVAHEDGTTYVVVNHNAELDFGSGPIALDDPDIDELSTLVRLSETGELLWSAQILGSTAEARTLAVDEDGRAIVSGIFQDTIDLGGETYENVFPLGQQVADADGFVFDVYISAFEPDGTYAWGEALGWMADEQASVARFEAGEVLLHRTSEEQFSLSSHTANGSDVLVAAEYEVPQNPFPLSAIAADADSVILSGRVLVDVSWPFDMSDYAKGNGDVVVVHIDR